MKNGFLKPKMIFFANSDDDGAVTRTLSIFISIFEVEKKLTASFITQNFFL